ncbi:hypothetical protein HDV00_010884 [Rhizophlyctis rosea]|nr:hypothetical protein HDV00_010884 [Rhizophlyctis rosea]
MSIANNQQTPSARDALTDIELSAYFSRIGLSFPSTPPPTLATLKALHKAHYYSIPFESLALHFPAKDGPPPSPSNPPVNISLDALVNKLIHNRRGGYCIENSTLFMAALKKVGFAARYALARIHRGGSWQGLSHIVILVRPEDAQDPSDVYMTDVGYGKDGPPFPLPLSGKEIDGEGQGWHRVRRATNDLYPTVGDPAFGRFSEWGVPPFYVMEWKAPKTSEWLPFYGFTTAPANPVDLQIINFYSCLSPNAFWVNNCVVRKPTHNGSIIYIGGAVKTYSGGDLIHVEEVGEEDGQREDYLKTRFGLDVANR